MGSLPRIGLCSKTSGRSFSNVPINTTVTMPSATPMIEWLIAIAGTATLNPYWNVGVESPNSVPAEIAARTSPKKAAMKMAPKIFLPSNFVILLISSP